MLSIKKLSAMIINASAKTSCDSRWTCAVESCVPSAFFGRLSTSPATVTFHDIPKTATIPLLKNGLSFGIHRKKRRCFFEKLKTFAIWNIFLSSSLNVNPDDIAEIRTGIDISTETTTGTESELNAKISTRIRATTGVERRIDIGRFRKSFIKLHLPHATPSTVPIESEIKKDFTTLKNVEMTFCQKTLCFMSEIRQRKTSPGNGRISGESTIFAAICHTRTIAHIDIIFGASAFTLNFRFSSRIFRPAVCSRLTAENSQGKYSEAFLFRLFRLSRFSMCMRLTESPSRRQVT